MTSPLNDLFRAIQMARAPQASGQPGAPAGVPPLGSGMAQQAAQILQSQPYRMHVQEAQALGQQPMTPEQFMQMQQGQARPPMPPQGM